MVHSMGMFFGSPRVILSVQILQGWEKGGSAERRKVLVPRDTSLCPSLSVNAACACHP